jgi:polyisoprenoid-binding protein YceI
MDYRLEKNYSFINWTAYQPERSSFGTVRFKQGKIRALEGDIISGFAQVDLSSIEVTDSKMPEEKRKKLEEHLKSSDFFNVSEFPSAVFEISSVKPSSGFATHIIEGEMTIKGITHHMIINANIVVTGDKIDLKAKLKINRTYYRIDFMMEEELGAEKILPEFELELSILAINTNN